MTVIDSRDIPADPESTERLAAGSLTYRVVDGSDATRAELFQRATTRGFLGAEPSTEELAFGQQTFDARRNTGVYETPAADTMPVATIDSWVTPVTLPGGRELPMWAISGVTVSATHRRRGIARALLEGELRSAVSAGVPIAGLTVSEATIYGRYGFGSALPMAKFTVDTRRAGWAGPAVDGRVEYVDRDSLAAALDTVHDRARSARSGQIPGWPSRWTGIAGLAPGNTDGAKVRGVRFLDRDGEVRGAMAFALQDSSGSFRFALDVRLLVAETPEATGALWRFALQHDLVDQVTADLRPLDDALPWLVRDPRGVTQTVHDHGWLRILDIPTALTARTYSAPLDLVIRVSDPLGFTAGDWRLRLDAQSEPRVEAVEGADVDAELDISALSILYAGGVRAASLHGAGRIVADRNVVEALDRAFVAFPAPALDIWY
ncbi:GNAT family N-acetyltransferase [Microbacterium phyllosphaerae]|uniref:GNAT family N-acetyltransferase n=1 Tax=Microbacterium phyllosphaerae TaxID=124798 RepID=UPI0021674E38|nr:GNAT family N-acetyltransferase [Microbacterium phyllosphaerae]MCS3441703.1 putative acetyltransferase [Microbacterium phyllosphaerae]